MSCPPAESDARYQILVCDGPSCGVTHESEVLVALLKERVGAAPGLRGRVYVAPYNCFGRCSEGPNLFVRRLAAGEAPLAEPGLAALERERGFYPGVDAAKCEAIVREHCGEGRAIEAWVDDY
jgi:(2Fe-2S) ferredoxin